MKKLSILLMVFSVLGCKSRIQEGEKGEVSENAPVISWKEDKFDFGTIKEGEIVGHDFSFENTGASPLVVSDVQVQCGCTVPQWPKEPILPGATSKISVKFNSAGKAGMQNKTVTVISNSANKTDKIMFTANVDNPNPPKPTTL